MDPKRNYYGDFNYAQAYGSNPFTNTSKVLGNLVGRMSQGQTTGAQGSAGSSASWASSYAKPDDPDVQAYMQHTLGGQRKALEDYVGQAAGAGIKRGGLNVVGGPALEASLHHMAMKNLAQGYAGRFREALDYAKGVRGEQYSRSRDAMQDLENFLGMQHRYLTSQADWQNRYGDTVHSDWRSDVDWNRAAPKRDLELESMRRRMETESLRNAWAREDRQLAMQEKERKESSWQQYADRMGQASRVGQFGTSWDAGDSAWLERLAVEMGYWKPLERSVQIRQNLGGGKG